ncbi:MAG: hypothetical protein V1837_08115 [Candidatus Woesearchaeota archaeon]
MPAIIHPSIDITLFKPSEDFPNGVVMVRYIPVSPPLGIYTPEGRAFVGKVFYDSAEILHKLIIPKSKLDPIIAAAVSGNLDEFLEAWQSPAPIKRCHSLGVHHATLPFDPKSYWIPPDGHYLLQN